MRKVVMNTFLFGGGGFVGLSRTGGGDFFQSFVLVNIW